MYLQLLEVTHFSPLSGKPDVPDNYHILTYELSYDNAQTHIVLTQDNNESEEELKHSQEMWDGMLVRLKKLLEN